VVTRPRDCSWVPGCFENIATTDFDCTSDPEDGYNCIAWALGKTDKWWWPKPTAPYFWPLGLPKAPVHVAEAIPNFLAAFRTEGYKVCRNGKFSRRYEKIALFVDSVGRPKHAARLLRKGVWSSKLGQSEDIEHKTLECLEGNAYGEVRIFLKRRLRQRPGRVAERCRLFTSRLFRR
jgi:hypothetical protein